MGRTGHEASRHITKEIRVTYSGAGPKGVMKDRIGMFSHVTNNRAWIALDFGKGKNRLERYGMKDGLRLSGGEWKILAEDLAFIRENFKPGERADDAS